MLIQLQQDTPTPQSLNHKISKVLAIKEHLNNSLSFIDNEHDRSSREKQLANIEDSFKKFADLHKQIKTIEKLMERNRLPLVSLENTRHIMAIEEWILSRLRGISWVKQLRKGIAPAKTTGEYSNRYKDQFSIICFFKQISLYFKLIQSTRNYKNAWKHHQFQAKETLQVISKLHPEIYQSVRHLVHQRNDSSKMLHDTLIALQKLKADLSAQQLSKHTKQHDVNRKWDLLNYLPYRETRRDIKKARRFLHRVKAEQI